MSDTVNKRKLEHLNVVRDDAMSDRQKFYFDDVHLTHRAMPDINLADVDSSVTFLGKSLSFPMLISSMTGGNHDEIVTINRNLAEAAERTQVAMGVGLTPDMCREAISVLDADGLFLHLNPLQEAAQAEGDTNFGGLSDRIAELVKVLEVPVILKEVGAGVSAADLELALRCGIDCVDVAGTGGTSWARIEQQRDFDNVTCDVGSVFQDWGIPTPIALRHLASYRDRVSLIASGGIRNGLDMAKAVVLGASLCGMARPFLAPAAESADAVVRVIETLRQQFRTAMFLLGATRVDQISGQDSFLLDASHGGSPQP
jgi:isopentenyl-diphosphate delta-isomerase